jgi:hypothetical protein
VADGTLLVERQLPAPPERGLVEGPTLAFDAEQGCLTRRWARHRDGDWREVGDLWHPETLAPLGPGDDAAYDAPDHRVSEPWIWKGLRRLSLPGHSLTLWHRRQSLVLREGEELQVGRVLREPIDTTRAALDPSARFLATGAPHPERPGHTAVWDVRRGRIAAWIPLHPGRSVEDLGWAQEAEELGPDPEFSREHPLRTRPRVELGAPGDYPPSLRDRVTRLRESWGREVVEIDVHRGNGDFSSAFLPRGAEPWALPSDAGPRFLLVDPTGNLFAWELTRGPERPSSAAPYPPVPARPVDRTFVAGPRAGAPGSAHLLWEVRPPLFPGDGDECTAPEPQVETAPEEGLVAVLVPCGWLLLRSAGDGRLLAKQRIPSFAQWDATVLRHDAARGHWIVTRYTPLEGFDSWETDPSRIEERRFALRTLRPVDRRETVGSGLPEEFQVRQIGLFETRLRPLPGTDQRVTRRGAEIHLEGPDGAVSPPLLDSPWGQDLAVTPEGRYLVTGAPLPESEGNVAVWDLSTRQVAAWIPLAPGRSRAGLGPFRDLGPDPYWGDGEIPDEFRGPVREVLFTRPLPEEYPEAVDRRLALLTWGGLGTFEYPFPGSDGRLRTAFTPHPAHPRPLATGQGPRFALMEADGILRAWEVRIPEAESHPPGPPPPPPTVRVLDPPQPRTHEITIEAHPPPAPTPGQREGGWLR